MPSWVRYSVTVYLGLLLAGSFVSLPTVTSGSQAGKELLPPGMPRVVEMDHEAAEAEDRCALCPHRR